VTGNAFSQLPDTFPFFQIKGHWVLAKRYLPGSAILSPLRNL